MSVFTSLLSKVPKIATGGMSTIYKWLAIGGVILGLCVGSYMYGVHVGGLSQKVSVAQQINKDQQKVITITKTQTVVDTNAVAAVQQKLDAEKGKTTDLQRKLSNLEAKQLTTITPTGSCNLSPDWVQLYNDSVKP